MDEYWSCPDYFGEITQEERERLTGKPEIFRELLSSPEKLAELSSLLKKNRSEFTFEEGRLNALATILGIKNALTSYEYLMGGEREGVTGWRQFIHIPDERAAKKEAAAALRREKQDWKKKGLLCNEWQPPCRKRDWEFSAPDFCVDPVSHGFAVLWRRVVGHGYAPQLHVLAPPWESKPQPFHIPFSSPNPSHPIISATGKWLALNDWGLRVFDWGERRMIANIDADLSPVAFLENETHLLCQGTETFTLLSLESMKPLWTIETARTCGALAVSPSAEYVITRFRDDEFQRVALATGEVRTMTLPEQNADAPDLMSAVEQIKKSASRDKWKDYVEGVFSSGGTTMLFAARFSADGQLLYCATSNGLRVYAFDELFSLAGTKPAALHAVTPVPEALALNVNHYDNYVYDVALDEPRNRLLFCGIEGSIRFLNLDDGTAGILVEVPGKPRIWCLKLSDDRRFLCCLSLPQIRKRAEESPRVQVWNYDALCTRAGLR